MPKPLIVENRHSPIRRQLNESFLDHEGKFNWIKFLSISGQFVLLYHLADDFHDLMNKWDALTLTCGFVIMPDMVRRIIASKYPVANGATKR